MTSENFHLLWWNLIASLILIYGFYNKWKESQFYKKGIKTRGRVVELESPIGEGDLIKTHVEYKVEGGRVFTRTCSFSYFEQPNINDFIEIIYDPDDCGVFVVDAKRSYNFTFVYCLVIACSMYLIPLLD